MQPDQKGGKKKWIPVILVAVVMVGFGIYYFLGSRPAKEPAPAGQPSTGESPDLTVKPSPNLSGCHCLPEEWLSRKVMIGFGKEVRKYLLTPDGPNG